MTTRRRARRGAGATLLVLALAVGGCSVARLGYENADWLLLREADGFMDLDTAQREALGRALEVRLERHRREELPHHLALLAVARRMIADGLDETETDILFGRVREQALGVVARTIPQVAPALAALRPEQIDHLAERMARRNERFRERHVEGTRERRLAARFERALERIEHWSGRLDADQRALVLEVQAGLPDATGAWLAWRERRQQALLALLREGADARALERFLTAWWVRFEGRDRELERWGRATWEGAKHLVLALDATLTERQRRRVLERIDDYLEALAPLAEDATGSPLPLPPPFT